jgi:hypothetical protein
MNMNGVEIALRAKEQLAMVTGLEVGTASGMAKEDDGWHVNVDLLELKRIPNTTDVLATYEAVLDDEGNLLRHRRMHRFYRAQVTEDNEE